MKAAFCTYCSAAKAPGPELLPAISRYQSRRIGAVHEAARQVGADFFILSGKFGMLKPEDLIPYYDHLMVGGDVPAMVLLVASQLKNIREATGLETLIFFSHGTTIDPQLAPYHQCLQEAGQIARVSVVLIDLQESITDA